MSNKVFLVRPDGSLELMEMDSTEQSKLRDLGFTPIRSEDGLAVFTSHPRSWDDNNGLVAVWLSTNECWVAPASLVREEITGIASDLNLKKGAYVPFSNDGGAFLQSLFVEA